jgi:uncharacterized protein involved in exopolysaccharide biosynthesis
MQDEIFNYARPDGGFTPRDVLQVVFRRRVLVMWCLAGSLAIGLLSALLLPKYQGEAKFLLMRERVDPSITPTPEENTFQVAAMPTVTQEDLNSEVEIIDSHEMLKNIVLQTQLNHQKTMMGYLMGWWGWWRTPDEKLEGSIDRLDKALDVETVKVSNIISVSYKNRDPEMIKRVLETLTKLYLEQHMAVHRPAGQYEFFDQQARKYRQQLEAAEQRLKEFPQQYGVVDPALDGQMVLQKLNDFNANLQQTRAEIRSTQQRINDLLAQQKHIPARMITTQTHSDNPQLLQKLKGTLLDLEIKRIELLTKYQPNYRPVQELEKQIADTRAAIATEESAPLRDVTTDADPTYMWIANELAKAQSDLAGYQARESALQRIVDQYRSRANELDTKSITLADLQRDVKTQETNYLLYERKREEAHITELLDRQRILNVAVAEAPSVPALPKHGPMLWGLIGTCGAMMLSVGAVWTVDHFDTTLHNPADLDAIELPLLAAIPASMVYHDGSMNSPDDDFEAGDLFGSKTYGNYSNGSANGNGNGNGKGRGDNSSGSSAGEVQASERAGHQGNG